jgi:DNA end-binding protein Ku
MQKENCWGVGQVVFSGKDQLVAVRPMDNMLHMAMLNYDEEIRRPADVMATGKRPRPTGRKVQLAQTLIKNWSNDHFDFAAYDDRYRDKVQELISAKVHGHEIVAPEEEAEPEVVNLMDALKKSLAHERPAKRRGKRQRKKSA